MGDDDELTVTDDQRPSVTVLASHRASTRTDRDLGHLVDRQSLRFQFTETHRADHAEGCLLYFMKKMAVSISIKNIRHLGILPSFGFDH